MIGFLGIIIMIGTDVLAVMNTNLLAHLAILGASVSYCFRRHLWPSLQSNGDITFGNSNREGNRLQHFPDTDGYLD